MQMAHRSVVSYFAIMSHAETVKMAAYANFATAACSKQKERGITLQSARKAMQGIKLSAGAIRHATDPNYGTTVQAKVFGIQSFPSHFPNLAEVI